MMVFGLMLAGSLGPLQQWAWKEQPRSPIVFPVVQLWMFLLLAAQGVLLMRVRPDRERPRTRRKLWPALIAGAFCFALLSSALVTSLAMAGAGDDAFQGLSKSVEAIEQVLPWAKAGRWLPMLFFFGFIGGMWTSWWIVLGPMTRNMDAQSVPARLLNWMLAGSVLELLIAVPCHVICRRREDCCAPLLTFWGMATGWAILLLSLGPTVGLLIERRLARLRPKEPHRHLSEGNLP